MIKVSCQVNNDSVDITMEGHANYEEHGKDIVCASVSILVYTLIAVLSNHSMPFPLRTFVLQYDGEHEKKWIKITEIERVAIDKITQDVQFFLTGVQLLANDYSQYVELLFTDSCQT